CAKDCFIPLRFICNDACLKRPIHPSSFPRSASHSFLVLKPDRLFLFHSMKRKQKPCQNEPSAGRFDGPPTRFDPGSTQHEQALESVALVSHFFMVRPAGGLESQGRESDFPKTLFWVPQP
ncbi:hypothetical protein, partial [Gaoshiqia sediminis]